MKIIFASIFFVISFISFSQQTFDDLLNKGTKHYQEGDLKGAISFYSEAINKDPKNVNGYYFRGQMLLLNNQFDDAIKDFNKVTILKDDFYQAYHYIASCYFYKGDSSMALVNENKCLKINPHFFDALQTKATYLILKKNIKEAEDLIDQCLKVGPKNPETNYHKGVCLFERDNLKDAILYFEKSYNLGYENDLLYNKMAVCYLKKGDLSKALLRINQAIILSPNLGYQYLNRALIYFQMSFSDAAIQDFEKAKMLNVSFDQEQKEIYNKLKS